MSSQRKKQIVPLPLLALVAVVLVFVIVMGGADGPWTWIALALQTIVTVALLIYLVRFMRKQRDDYWREHGKDPKHPEL